MAAIYGSYEHIWNKSIDEEYRLLLSFLKKDFPTINLIGGVVIATFAPVIMVSNAIVITAIWKDPYKQLRASPSNIIIASMAVCDFLVGAVCSFMQCYWLLSMAVQADFSFYAASCAFGIGLFLIGVSVFHVLALTIDRVISVTNPLLYKVRVTKKRVTYTVSIIWIFFIIMGGLTVPLYNHYYIHSILGAFIVLFAVLAVSFFSFYIVLKVRQQQHELKEVNAISMKNGSIKLREKKLTKSIVLIAVILQVCFAPLCIFSMLLLMCSVCHGHVNIIIGGYCLSLVLTHVNSCLNPFIYAFRLPKFRKPVSLVVKWVFCCKPIIVHLNECPESSATSPKMNRTNILTIPDRLNSPRLNHRHCSAF
ncbi:adenosine receptor A1-like [Exaiptasia diaphana]|uniref:G-protein coupled receptors family 1 profile domain-containing protein n=1 Tax=Exaiptasia diaphana TaxID=2652724 RepID=A0A913YAC1_EXADI|nr:adenosine receptor A1-like [Exaiptasia diaphana]